MEQIDLLTLLSSYNIKLLSNYSTIELNKLLSHINKLQLNINDILNKSSLDINTLESDDTSTPLIFNLKSNNTPTHEKTSSVPSLRANFSLKSNGSDYEIPPPPPRANSIISPPKSSIKFSSASLPNSLNGLSSKINSSNNINSNNSVNYNFVSSPDMKPNSSGLYYQNSPPPPPPKFNPIALSRVNKPQQSGSMIAPASKNVFEHEKTSSQIKDELRNTKSALSNETENLFGSTEVSSVIHQSHVSTDINTCTYHNLPADWDVASIKKQFGLDPKLVESVKLSNYNLRIPRLLVFLKEKLISSGGLEAVGIFRVAPDADECSFYKKEIDQGRWTANFKNKDIDSSVYANLIKVWFRDLPVKLLNCVDTMQILKCDTEFDAGSILETMPDPFQSLLLWLLDLCILISSKEDVNKMTPLNLAICFGPNLSELTDFTDPFQAIQHSQKVCGFLHRCILYRKMKNNQ